MKERNKVQDGSRKRSDLFVYRDIEDAEADKGWNSPDIEVRFEWYNSHLEFDIQIVTPEIAQEWLKTNEQNRNISPAHLRKIVSAIERDEWMPTNNCIAFDEDNRLIDSQHRLQAIVNSGKRCICPIITGFPRETQKVIDQNKKRKLIDWMDMSKEEVANKTHVGTIINRVHKYRNGSMLNNEGYPSIDQGLDMLTDEFDELLLSGRMGKRVSNHFKIPAGITGFCHHIFYSLSEADTEEFFEKLVKGTGLVEKEPVHTLRRYYERQTMMKVESHGKTKIDDDVSVMAKTIKAWNAFRENKRLTQKKEVTQLRYQRGGKTKKGEDFPVAI